MNSSLETSVVAVVAVVIFYLILSGILSFTWNRSVSPVFNLRPVGVMEALFLLLTMNILFGTFSQSALVVYNNYVPRV
jgi:hypothetical protein